MSRQNLRLVCMLLSAAIAIVAADLGYQTIVAAMCFASGAWFSAYMRRFAFERGLFKVDEP